MSIISRSETLVRMEGGDGKLDKDSLTTQRDEEAATRPPWGIARLRTRR